MTGAILCIYKTIKCIFFIAYKAYKEHIEKHIFIISRKDSEVTEILYFQVQGRSESLNSRTERARMVQFK